MMETKIRRWGNSLGLRIPSSFAREAGVGEGSTVDITVDGEILTIRPAKHRRYRLDDLLKKVTTKNRHEEIDTSDPIGREIW
ncbi:MAG: AbrB/MazE/SpoVT family DNA-binding domain-containing protein [Candidatus Eisenbacteria bacterium]|nr:AbrB/MazE/SpoVT family DNA-binding domain-containing protein [Candidatus Eisenbacteria bacterium]